MKLDTTEWVWDGDAPPLPQRVLLVSPHPDDEVIGAAGLLVELQAQEVPVCLVAVTDGEASHSRSSNVTPSRLRSRRDIERRAALEVLDVTVDLVRLGLPDGAVRDEGALLTDALCALADESTVVIAPWRHDGHPDHEAAGSAAARASERTGAVLWEVPIWAKVTAAATGARPPGRSALVLSAVMQRRKREAIACYASQLIPLGDSPVDGPVVHPHELEAMLNGREEVLWT